MKENDKCHCPKLGIMIQPAVDRLRATYSPGAEKPAKPEHERSVKAIWNYTLGSLVFFFLVLDALIIMVVLNETTESDALFGVALLVLVLGASAMNIRYCWFLRAGRGGGLPETGWTVALLAPALAAWVLALFQSSEVISAALLPWLALSQIACLMSGRWRWALLAVGAGLVAIHPLLAGAAYDRVFNSASWMLVVYSGTLPFMLLSSLWLWEVIVKLDRHRAMAADLAVAHERLRFAADLHDIQGHHLQVIALKAELAERLLERDPQAASRNVAEVRAIAKQAMEETRSLVAGYRNVALDNALDNANEVLRAAGAQCELTVTGALPAVPAIQQALAMAVREGTTNILRHSSATVAAISLTTTAERCTLLMTNNALTPGGGSGPAPGSGLAGLRERARALAGDAASTTDLQGDRFELELWIPLPTKDQR